MRSEFTAFNRNFSGQFTLNKGWAAEISGWYNSKNYYSCAILAQRMGMFSVGCNKQILKSKAIIKLNVRDPFYLAHFKGSTDLNQGVTQIKSYWDNRRGIITFTYRFGKNTAQQVRHNTASEDEQNGVKAGKNHNKLIAY